LLAQGGRVGKVPAGQHVRPSNGLNLQRSPTNGHFLFQPAEQVQVEVLHLLSRPALLRDAGQAHVGHPGPPGHLCAGDRGAGGAAAAVVGVRVGRIAAHLLPGPLGRQGQQGARNAEVHGGHPAVRHPAAALLLRLLLLGRVGVRHAGQVHGAGRDGHFRVARKLQGQLIPGKL